jgi:glycosyltransferase involved in cell wall biosynthesis
MRVVHIEAGMNLYGGAAQVLYLLGGLATRGIDNVLMCPRGSAIASAAAESGFEVAPLPMSGDLDVGLFFRVRQRLAELAPDLVHVHSRRGADIYGGWAARSVGIPAVISRRVDNLEPRWRARLRYRPYQAVVGISAAIRDLLETRMGVAPHKLHHVASAVDTRRFRPRDDDVAAATELSAALGFPNRRRLIGVVAQFIERKGHADVLAAVGRLGAEHDDVAVVLFGQGPLEATLRRKVAALGLEKRVFFAGFRGDMERWLPLLTLLVHPARAEGLGVALLEAQACGVPVVAAAAGGIPQVIEDGVTGLLVPIEDVAALAAALSKLLRDPVACERMGVAARQRVEARFSIPAMVNGNLAVYEQVLKEAG